MKKKYSKPQIAFDSFEIASSIADACGTPAEFAQGECGVTIGFLGVPAFSDDISGCILDATQDDGEYGICYYVPMADIKVFGS